MEELRYNHFIAINDSAKSIAKKFSKGKIISEAVLKTIISLYKSAQTERRFREPGKFDCAYHAPVTHDFEFFIARILYYHNEIHKLGWEILLRKQKGGMVPDVRIAKNDKNIAIIEAKVKGGFIQHFLSEDRFNNDIIRFPSGETKYNPVEKVKEQREQLDKYLNHFEVDKENLFYVIPTLAMVHRKKYGKDAESYSTNFNKNSSIPKENFVLISNSLALDLAEDGHDININVEYEPTDRFERMLTKLSSL